jgi:hypothetical protein
MMMERRLALVVGCVLVVGLVVLVATRLHHR